MDRLAAPFYDSLFAFDAGAVPPLDDTLDARYMLPGDVPRVLFDHHANATGPVVGFDLLGHAYQRQSPTPSVASSSSSSYYPHGHDHGYQYHPHHHQPHQQDDLVPALFQQYLPPREVSWMEYNLAPPVPKAEPLPTTPPRAQGAYEGQTLVSTLFDLGHKTGKPSGACTRCKRLKMKCETRSGQSKCQRCKGGDYDCVPAIRRPRQRKVDAAPLLAPHHMKRARAQASPRTPPSQATTPGDASLCTPLPSPPLNSPLPLAYPEPV
ncbi:hypothetical protein AURDEDRAFT_125543 [Auricularia subglabra TFB-10046 SS5]|nr:hypothetical protein AURDEDRAFT_125543 [Auricularia subglabra TFB-10046 SS5]